jgi:hypothetical protein
VVFLNNLISKLLGSNGPTQADNSSPILPASASGLVVTVSYSGPTQSGVTISEAEVAEATGRYNFVLTNEVGSLKTADQWYEEATQKRRLRDGSEKAYEWLHPFLPREIAKLDQLKPILEWGPNSASGVAKTLRALIRERRKAKQPCDDLLSALCTALASSQTLPSLLHLRACPSTR